jgi:hypothetical protein
MAGSVALWLTGSWTVRKLGGYVVDESGEGSGGTEAVMITVKKVRGEIRTPG